VEGGGGGGGGGNVTHHKTFNTTANACIKKW